MGNRSNEILLASMLLAFVVAVGLLGAPLPSALVGTLATGAILYFLRRGRRGPGDR